MKAYIYLYRPCAMVVPDFELICEINLIAEGFQNARILARKFLTLYSLCKELLSKQDHYDWGLRAIKSLLVVAGSLKVKIYTIMDFIVKYYKYILNKLQVLIFCNFSTLPYTLFFLILCEYFPLMSYFSIIECRFNRQRLALGFSVSDFRGNLIYSSLSTYCLCIT